MTIIIEALQNDEMRMGESKLHVDPKELVLDGGFVVPEANAFGQTFRDYEAESERQKTVEEFYRINHINQSVEFVKRMREEYGKLSRGEMSIWECCELLNEFVDESDPDLDEPQIEHLLQTAEAIRRDYPDEDWLHLTGLIHDLGKVLLHPSFGQLPQWAVVGDTFPVGCAYDESNVHRKFFEGNPDYFNPEYNTKCGIYSEGCGLDNVLMSWGHDDYMYLVAKENKTTLPSAGLFIIRYHSFYPLHKYGAYQHLMNEEDKENLKWLHIFNKFDLYSKSKVRIDVEKVKPYYLSLIEKVVAYATFSSPQSAVTAMAELNGVIFDAETGATLHIELARSNSRRRPRGDVAYDIIDKRTWSSDGKGGSDEPSGTENDNSSKKGAAPQRKRKADAALGARDGQSENPSSGAISPCSTLFIANLSPSCTEEELKQILSECCGFQVLKMRKKFGKPVAFADFSDVESATECKEKLLGTSQHAADDAGLHLEYARAKMRKT